MKRIILCLLSLVIVASAQAGFALTIEGTAPQFGTTGNPTTDFFINGLNQEIQNQFNDALMRVDETLAKLKTQDKLTQGFASANAYGSKTASMWGYQGYSLFAIMAGAGIGAQLPTSLSLNTAEMFDKLKQTGEKAKEEGDIEAGLSPSASINVGFHLGIFLPKFLKKLYVNAKWFSYNGSQKIGDTGNVNYETTNFGIGVNYQLIEGFSPILGIVKWRGISLGTGFIYQKNKVTFVLDYDDITESVSYGTAPLAFSGNITVSPDLQMGLDLTTTTIPFEITTSMRLLWVLNLTLGFGLDFNFGTSKLILESSGEVTFTETSNLGSILPQTTPGTISIDATQSSTPKPVTPRFMMGVGVNVGPIVAIDLAAVYYYATKGVAINISAGFVW